MDYNTNRPHSSLNDITRNNFQQSSSESNKSKSPTLNWYTKKGKVTGYVYATIPGYTHNSDQPRRLPLSLRPWLQLPGSSLLSSISILTGRNKRKGFTQCGNRNSGCRTEPFQKNRRKLFPVANHILTIPYYCVVDYCFTSTKERGFPCTTNVLSGNCIQVSF